jgi:hypothetical protein
MKQFGANVKIRACGVGTILAALGLLLTCGCTSTSPSGAKVTASLAITGRSLTEIRVASIEVFQKNAYEVKSAFGRNLVFEKYGGTMSTILYGTWMDPSVWFRIKLRIEEMRPGEHVLECNVFRVKDRDDPVLEEETRAYGKSSRPFKEILQQIKTTVEAKPHTGPS